MLLRFDLDLRREAGAQKLRTNLVTELGLGGDQKVVGGAAEHTQGRNHARLRREKEGLAGGTVVERLDVVRDHALQVVLGVPTGDPNKRPRTARDRRRL